MQKFKHLFFQLILFLIFPFLSYAQNGNTFPSTGNVGIGTTNPNALLHIDNGALLITGNNGFTPVSGSGTRLVWIPGKAAFRAGSISGTQWDDANIGSNSFAGGLDNTAKGQASAAFGSGNSSSGSYTTSFGANNNANGLYSVVFGSGNTAGGTSAIAFGTSSQANGDYSIAFGQSSQASGNYGTAFGVGTSAAGDYSTVFGTGNNASGLHSTAYGNQNNISAAGEYATVFGSLNNATAFYTTVFGVNNTAGKQYATCFGTGNTAQSQYSTVFGTSNNTTGDFATVFGTANTASNSFTTAFGTSNTASGLYATAFGTGNHASGDFSTVLGQVNTAGGYATFVSGIGNKAQSYNSFVIGQYNIDNGNSTAWIATDPLFTIGNGTSATVQSNAVTVLKNGNVGIGRTAPAALLDVNGTGKFTGFQLSTGAGAGKVLVSDANGNAAWANSAGVSGWTVSGNNLFFNNSGAIGINCTVLPASYKLVVNGDIRTRRIRVDHDTWCDYVFAENYNLRPLNELESFIKTYKHLPEIPSTEEVKSKGVDLGEMDEKLLKKVEEMTLYIIELEKRISVMEAENKK